MSISLRTAVTAVTAATLLTLAVTACTGTGSTASGPPAPGGGATAGSSAGIIPDLTRLHWSACTGQLSGMQCGSLQVPVNYADPNGRKITLALSMVPATAPKSRQQGVLLVNPGGPGGPGRWLAGAVAQGIAPNVAAQYDIVGFDPRGVASSVPALSCDPTFFNGNTRDYVPASAAAEQVLINRAKAYAAGCEKRFGWLLPYMATTDVARDMDSIRQAFGVQKINYYGISYGTYLGQVYATRFPGHLRRMVLDSTVDPTGVWYADNIDQDYAFQARMLAFFAWTAKYDSTYHLGATAAQVQTAWYRARSRLKAHPVSGAGGLILAEDQFDDTFLQGGYLNTLWPDLAQSLSQYLNSGTTGAIMSQYQENGLQDENENQFAVYNAVQCADVNWPRNWSKWHSDAEKVYETAPFQAWDNTWFNAACAFWPVTGPAKPLQIKGQGLPPILMLQGTLDAATPYPGAQDAHKLLPSARMVVVEGGGNHGQSLESPANTCVQNYLSSYLGTGAVPEHPGLVNATCPPVPDPVPGS